MENSEDIGVAASSLNFSGAIFMSNRATRRECLTRELFALPSSFISFVEKIKSGMTLFLFEYEERKLYGVYEATSDGGLNIEPHAFASSGKSYCAQIRIRSISSPPPLLESEFSDAIKDNYYTFNKFHFELSRTQVDQLIELYHAREIKRRLSLCQFTGRTVIKEFNENISSNLSYPLNNRPNLKESWIYDKSFLNINDYPRREAASICSPELLDPLIVGPQNVHCVDRAFPFKPSCSLYNSCRVMYGKNLDQHHSDTLGPCYTNSLGFNLAQIQNGNGLPFHLKSETLYKKTSVFSRLSSNDNANVQYNNRFYADSYATDFMNQVFMNKRLHPRIENKNYEMKKLKKIWTPRSHSESTADSAMITDTIINNREVGLGDAMDDDKNDVEDNNGTTSELGSTFLNFKRRSHAKKTASEINIATSPEVGSSGQIKRRKLIRPSFDEWLSQAGETCKDHRVDQEQFGVDDGKGHELGCVTEKREERTRKISAVVPAHEDESLIESHVDKSLDVSDAVTSIKEVSESIKVELVEHKGASVGGSPENSEREGDYSLKVSEVVLSISEENEKMKFGLRKNEENLIARETMKESINEENEEIEFRVGEIGGNPIVQEEESSNHLSTESIQIEGKAALCAARQENISIGVDAVFVAGEESKNEENETIKFKVGENEGNLIVQEQEENSSNHFPTKSIQIEGNTALFSVREENNISIGVDAGFVAGEEIKSLKFGIEEIEDTPNAADQREVDYIPL